MQLLIGCGSNREKKLIWQGCSEWNGLVTLDYEASHNPDVVHDLHHALPFADDTADEIPITPNAELLGNIVGDANIFEDRLIFHAVDSIFNQGAQIHAFHADDGLTGLDHG